MAHRIDRASPRTWMVRWLLAVSIVHLAVGVLLPWCANAPLFDGYHRGIEAAFWPAGAPERARDMQTWWIALFGATVQAMALWMIALVRLADRLRDARTWLWLVAGLALWAPQDMLVSLRADCWPHVWLDSAALMALLPPLCWLYLHDRRVAPAPAAAAASMAGLP